MKWTSTYRKKIEVCENMVLSILCVNKNTKKIMEMTIILSFIPFTVLSLVMIILSYIYNVRFA